MHDVIDAVGHRVTAAADAPGALVVEDDAYRATFDPEGLALSPSAAEDAGFRLSLDEVHRHDVAVPLALGAWQADGNVVRRPLGSGLSEQMTARGGEVEWDVVLAEPLAGSGDLHVSAGLSGAAGPPESTGTSLRWPLAGGGTVAMGEVVVKDALGTEVHRSLPLAETSSVRLEAPASILASATYPLTVDPTVSPAFPVSDPVTGPAIEDQGQSDVAFDGTNFLIVWQDERGDTGMCGARVDRSGSVLDRAGILIDEGASQDASEAPALALAWNGANFLVAWSPEHE